MDDLIQADRESIMFANIHLPESVFDESSCSDDSFSELALQTDGATNGKYSYRQQLPGGKRGSRLCCTAGSVT